MFHGTCGGTVSRVKNNTISMREYFFCNQILLGQCQCMRGSTCSTKLVDWLLQSVTIFNSWPEICCNLLLLPSCSHNKPLPLPATKFTVNYQNTIIIGSLN